MATPKDPRQPLEAKRERLLGQLAKEATRQTAVVQGLGFGYAMRSYHRLKNLSFAKETTLREHLQGVEAELTQLGWRNPHRPAEPVRTEEEALRHYCQVMGLDYEAEIKALNRRQAAQQGILVALD